MPFETPILTAVPAVLGLALKGAQTSFEFQRAPEQTRAILESIASARSDIVNAKEGRVALAKLYSSDDLAQYDRAVKETEAALTRLEKLVEPARIDFQHNDGKLKARTRLSWVVKDSKSLSATSHRLTVAQQRLSFAIMMMQMKIHNDRGEGPSVSLENIAPPPYVTNRRTPARALENRQRTQVGRISRSVSVDSAPEDISHLRPVPRTRMTTIPAMSREEEDFDELLNQHEQTPNPPPLGPLGPLLASVEALHIKKEPDFETHRALHLESRPAAQSAFSISTVPLASASGIPAMRSNDIRPRQRPAYSPQITPPDSPFQAPTNPPWESTFELGTTADDRPRVHPGMSLDRLSTLLEASSIRFELDATQEAQTSEILDLPAFSHTNSPPVPSTQELGRQTPSSPTSSPQARQVQALPYPDHQRPDMAARLQTEPPTTPSTVTISKADSKPPTRLNNTPQFFAGHRQPVNIRWKPRSSETPKSESSRPYRESPQSPMSRTQNTTLEFMYQPYRPAQ